MPQYRQNISKSKSHQSHNQPEQFPPWVDDFLAHGTVKGSRNDTIFKVASQFREHGKPFAEAQAAILPPGRRSGLSEAEILKAIASAYNYARGSGRNGGVRTATATRAASRPATPPPDAVQAVQRSRNAHQPLSNLPVPIPDGFRTLLSTLFEPGEGVALSESIIQDGKRTPGAGAVLSREAWLDRIAKKPIAEIHPYDGGDGSFIRINPIGWGGKSDSEVTSLRHVLVEFDLDKNGMMLPKLEQYNWVVGSGLPIAAVTDTGNKSLHFIVRINAGDFRDEFDRRRDIVFALVDRDGFDSKNKNPSRYSRLPDVERLLYDEEGNHVGTGSQRLLAVNLGPKDWDEFERRLSAASFPEIVSGEEIETNILPEPMEIIGGIIARGEKGSLSGGTKSFKTWTLIAQALAIASGIDWWGFPTTKSHIVFLNLEIPRAYFDGRVRRVADALGISIPKMFHVWHLRHEKLGNPDRWEQFLNALKDRCASIPNPFLTSDPIYKLLGGRNENAAGDVQLLLEQLDDMIQAVDGCNFFGHHYSKGNQASKEAIDRGAGSGVFQRDPDTICSMTPHEKDGCFSVESQLRNHQPIDPFVVEWRCPLFERVNGVDPQKLKKPKNPNQTVFTVQQLVDELGSDCLKAKDFLKRMDDETGMKERRFYELLKEAVEKKLIIKDGITRTYERNGTL